jgi:hypothetical protein
VARAASLLLAGAVLGKSLQPYESHIPFILQFLVIFRCYVFQRNRLVTRILSNLAISDMKVILSKLLRIMYHQNVIKMKNGAGGILFLWDSHAHIHVNK